MDSSEEIFYNREEKLSYVFKKLSLKTNEIAEKLEISAGLVSQIQNHYNNKLRKVHLYALSYAYNIPLEIFENENINTPKMIDKLLIQNISKPMFQKNYELLDKLIGRWYLYSYPSQSKLSPIWATETIIQSDFSVEDMHQNRGQLFIGNKQSIILKESHNSKNITSITFDNDRITYNNFPFSRVSKSNSLNKELFNFGFFSRRKIDGDEAKEILGDVEKAQLQMDYTMLERISSAIIMKG